MKTAAIDIGLKRIGIAVSLDEKIVIPLNAVLRKNRNQAAKDVDRFLKEYSIRKVIVGIPKGGKSEEEMKRRIEHFISLLEFDQEIIYIDEYGTSYEAKEMTKGVFKQKRDGKIDSVAAALILQRYLDLRREVP